MEQNSYHNAFEFLKQTIIARIASQQNREFSENISLQLEPKSFLAQLITKNKSNADEVIVLLLALVPHVFPSFLDDILSEFYPAQAEVSDFGGHRGVQFRGIQPTAATACFILAGNNIERRIEIMRLFEKTHWFAKQSILSLEAPPLQEPKISGRLLLDEEYIELLTTGRIARPDVGYDFAAEYIETPMDWGDLVLSASTTYQIDELKSWIKHEKTLMEEWGMSKKVKPGFRVLMHGPPGTGKTLTTLLLGKSTGRDVFRIDLSQMVSKYIGETSKNLARLFDKATNKNWILFFDEGEVMLSARTASKDANDTHSNQVIAYLLQRIETFNGLVVVATNLKSNMDEAFIRRFQSIIYFPKPNAAERLLLWKKALPKKVKLDKSLNLNQIAEKYELTGSNIINIVQKACLQLIDKKTTLLSMEILLENIKKEYHKEGKMV